MNFEFFPSFDVAWLDLHGGDPVPPPLVTHGWPPKEVGMVLLHYDGERIDSLEVHAASQVLVEGALQDAELLGDVDVTRLDEDGARKRADRIALTRGRSDGVRSIETDDGELLLFGGASDADIARRLPYAPPMGGRVDLLLDREGRICGLGLVQRPEQP